MDHPAVIFRFISDWKRRQGCMAFREVLVTQMREVLRAWLAGAGKRPAARRAGVDVKTAARYIRAAQAAGLARGGSESQLSDELIGFVVAAVRPARPAGHGASWEALVPVKAEITGWVKDDLTLVKIGELLERRGIVVPYRTLARFAAAECGYSSSRSRVTVPVADGKPGEEALCGKPHRASYAACANMRRQVRQRLSCRWLRVCQCRIFTGFPGRRAARRGAGTGLGGCPVARSWRSRPP